MSLCIADNRKEYNGMHILTEETGLCVYTCLSTITGLTKCAHLGKYACIHAYVCVALWDACAVRKLISSY